MTHLSLLLLVHNEGNVLLPTLKSLERSVRHARRHGVRCEWIVVADAVDGPTQRILNAHASLFDRVDCVEFRDPALARRAGVLNARGAWVFMADGDDLYDEAWLLEGARWASAADVRSVVHPQWNLFFGETAAPYLFEQLSEESLRDRREDWVEHNFYTALCGVNRDWFLQVPQRATKAEEGRAFEDWDWNLQVLQAGGRHCVLPGILHGVRRKAQASRNAEAQQGARLPLPNAYVQGLARELTAQERAFLSAAEADTGARYQPVSPSVATSRRQQLHRAVLARCGRVREWAWFWRAWRGRAALPWKTLREWRAFSRLEPLVPVPRPALVENLLHLQLPRSRVGLAFAESFLKLKSLQGHSVGVEVGPGVCRVETHDLTPYTRALSPERTAFLLARLVSELGIKGVQLQGQGEAFGALSAYLRALRLHKAQR